MRGALAFGLKLIEEVGQALLPRVLAVAMEWAGDGDSLVSLVESGNRALFNAMRNYRAERDGALFDHLVREIETSIIERR